MKYTFREPYILLKQYTSKQRFGNGHPAISSNRRISMKWMGWCPWRKKSKLNDVFWMLMFQHLWLKVQIASDDVSQWNEWVGALDERSQD